MKTVEILSWAINTIRDQLMFGLPELQASRSRERRAKGAMIGARRYIVNIENYIESIKENKTGELACETCSHVEKCNAKLTDNCTDVLLEEIIKIKEKGT